MVARGDIVFRPTVSKPALDIAVEAYSRFAMRLLASITRFDRVMGHFDFPIWNAVRDLSDVDEESRAPRMELPAVLQRCRQCLRRRFKDFRQGRWIANASGWTRNG